MGDDASAASARSGALLTFEEFRDVLVHEFDGEIDPSALRPKARLIADLDLDSFQLLRLGALVESLLEEELPTDLDPSDASLGDVFYYYETIMSRADDQPT